MSVETFGTIYAGEYTAHVVDDDGGIWYAGYCYQGRCGDGASSTDAVYDLTRIAGINNVIQLDENRGAGVALTGGGAVWYVRAVRLWCWPRNDRSAGPTKPSRLTTHIHRNTSSPHRDTQVLAVHG
jgi:hypothetical protein